MKKPVGDFFFSLLWIWRIFNRAARSIIFHLFWLSGGMPLALNEGCFSVVTLFSASLCLCGLRLKWDAGLIPSQAALQISLRFSAIKPWKKRATELPAGSNRLGSHPVTVSASELYQPNTLLAPGPRPHLSISSETRDQHAFGLAKLC